MPLFGTGRNIKGAGRKDIGLLTPLAGRGFKLQVFDIKRGDFISSEELDPSDTVQRVSDRKIKDLYLNLPLSMLSLRLLSLPFSDKKRLTEVIPYELQGLILEDIDEIVFDSFCLGEEGQGFNILVTYIERDRLETILEELLGLGMDPSIVGSIELDCLIRKAKSPGLLIEGLANHREIQLENMMDCIREELVSPLINLRTGPFEYKRDKARLTSSLRLMTFLLITIAVIINIDLSLRLMRDKEDIALIRKEMRRSYLELFPSEKRVVNETNQLKAHLKEAQQMRDFTEAIPVLDYLSRLSHVRPQGVIFHELSLSQEGLSIKGEAGSMDDVNNLKAGLSGFIEDVRAFDIKPLSGKQLFTISGRYKR